ncbi:uncharacterized protein N7459_005827 [Penicillium hispanicum]|uniref:uncharacterized protein n=1 Tax=Penicillium hispanicum TaxID=1080232 RepID=UPI00253FCB05|nr:uncharacterized protein N7459_005827 [Penicillium hispanicum]KAJ5579842.1 hypothetical protein N7459_005827 [Penicillium hispanicum]
MPKQKRTSASLSKIAFNQLCRQLETTVVGEDAAASFLCGGTIPIEGPEAAQPAKPTKRAKGNEGIPEARNSSSPVSLFWDSKNDSQARKLVLPLGSSTPACNSSDARLRQLVEDCEPASFGRGQETVMDPEYRKAGKLDTHRFVTSFHPADFGIIENIQQILAPGCNIREDNFPPVGLRRVEAELYKLNVYSGPSGLFQSHVDTPRSNNQIGSLVVCLPCPFKGGNLIVRHNDREMNLQWEHRSADTIQWAAFYSDCEHEIKTISGVLGFFCSHAYPHTSDDASQFLPHGLKGADLALYAVLRSFRIQVEVLPVLISDDEKLEDSDLSYGSSDSDDYYKYKEVGKTLVGTSLQSFFCANNWADEPVSEVIQDCWPERDFDKPVT